MQVNKVDAIMMQYRKLIPADEALSLRNQLLLAPDTAYSSLAMVETKDPTLTVILSIFLGGIGVDRFYIGDVGLGICKLLFGWITFGLWPLIDIFCSYKKAKIKNMDALLEAAHINIV